MKKYIFLLLILFFTIPLFSQVKVGTITLRDSSGTLVVNASLKSNGSIGFYYIDSDSIQINGVNINKGGLSNVAYLDRTNVFDATQQFNYDILVTGLGYIQTYLSVEDSILVGGKNINQFRTLSNVVYKNDTNAFTGLNTFSDKTYFRKDITIGTVPVPASLEAYGNITAYGYIDGAGIYLSGTSITTPGIIPNLSYKSDTAAYLKTQQWKQGTNITLSTLSTQTVIDLTSDGNLFTITNFSTLAASPEIATITSTNFTVQEGMTVTFLCLGANDSASYFKHEAGATVNGIKLKDAIDYNVIKHCIISFAYLNDQWWEVYRTEF